MSRICTRDELARSFIWGGFDQVSDAFVLQAVGAKDLDELSRG